MPMRWGDVGREFEVRFTGSFSGTPVDVWEAITRGRAGWLWPLDLQTREGAVAGERSNGGDVVAVWDPPRHLTLRWQGEEGWFTSLDYVLEAWNRGTFLRYTQTGVLGEDDWENEYEACRQHTEFHYHSLGEYLRHFKGRPVTCVQADAPERSAKPGSFTTLRAAIGLADKASVGDRVRFQVPGLDPVAGALDYLTANFVGVRTVDALYRFYGRDAFGWPVGVAHHLFAAEVDAEKATRAWAAWLDGLYG
jgi:hypothetical protein